MGKRTTPPGKLDVYPIELNKPPPADPGSMPTIDEDPLRAMLNGVAVKSESPEDTVPEEIAEFFAMHDFSNRYFQVILKRVDEGAGESSSSSSFIRSWYRTVPSLQFVAKHYGPGKYIFAVSWRYQSTLDGEDGEMKNASQRIFFEIDDACEEEHLEFLRQMKIERTLKTREKLRNSAIGKKIDDDLLGSLDTEKKEEEPKQTAKEYVREIMDMSRDLGLTRENQGGGSIIKELLPLLPVLMPLVTAMLDKGEAARQRAEQQQNMFMTMLLQMSDKSNNQMLEFVKSSQGAGSGMNAVKEFKDMVFGAMDIKEAINGKTESPLDKVLGVVEAVLPQLLTVAAMSKQQRAVDPRATMAQAFVASDANFQTVLRDPAQTREMIIRLDGHFGFEQTDMILGVANIERPTDCPRDPSQRLPIAEREQPLEVFDGQNQS
jgi:hypothetical protein